MLSLSIVVCSNCCESASYLCTLWFTKSKQGCVRSAGCLCLISFSCAQALCQL
jgi:hypothetical protein